VEWKVGQIIRISRPGVLCVTSICVFYFIRCHCVDCADTCFICSSCRIQESRKKFASDNELLVLACMFGGIRSGAGKWDWEYIQKRVYAEVMGLEIERGQDKGYRMGKFVKE
jgi:hypothetical protein